MPDIYIGMTRTRTIVELRRMLDEAERSSATGREDLRVELVGEPNGPGEHGDVRLIFSNDDMEGREEVADKVLIDIEEQ